MNKILINHHYYTTTETGREYRDHCRSANSCPRPLPRPKLADELIEADILIYNKQRNNLQVADDDNDACQQPKPEPEQPAPAAARRRIIPNPQPISYSEYAGQLARCWPHLFANIETEHLKATLRDLHRSIYHSSYCRPEDGLVSQQTRRRQAQRDGALPASWPIDTTYQSSWRTPQQIRTIGTIGTTESCRPRERDAALKAQLRKIFAFGRSEYRERVCELAELSLELGKYGRGPPRAGYFDRYTKQVD